MFNGPPSHICDIIQVNLIQYSSVYSFFVQNYSYILLILHFLLHAF